MKSFNLGYKKVGFIHQVISHNKSSKNVGEVSTRRLKPINSNTTPPNVSIASIVTSSKIIFNPTAHVMHMFAIDLFF
jgi:hypothetical protein